MGNCCDSPVDPSEKKEKKAKNIKGKKQNPYSIEYNRSPVPGAPKLVVLKESTGQDISSRYQLGNELGRGEFGITYLCIDKDTGEKFACKSISKKKLRTAVDIEDVRREVQIMKHMPPHPNVVSLKNTYEDDNAVHIVMELCEGGELFDRIVARGHYTERAAAAVTKTIVEVVQGEEVLDFLLPENENFPHLEYDSEFTVIGDKKYSIGGSEGIANFSINVKVFDKQSRTWLEPIVFGTKPVASNGHSSFLLDDERVLIILWESSPDNSIWFLEVGTPFVKQKSKQLGAEVVAWSKGLIGYGSKPIVISGPSGVGKGTLIAKLMEEFPSNFGFSVSHTTRAPRQKEANGVHYHFTERSKMEKDIQDGKFLEFASVHGNLYGTSVEAVEAVSDAGKRCILDIDVQGARSVRASPLEAIFIFVRPPSFEELETRLRARGTETEEQIQKRLSNARAELEQATLPGLFDHILINDDLESCYQNLKKLLALDEIDKEPSQPFMKSFMLPFSHSISKAGNNKVIIHCGTNELSSSPSTKFILDLSSLRGGAPGRTRGLTLCTTNS